MEDEEEIIDDDEFIRRYEAYEMEEAANHITRYCKTELELRSAVEFIIRNREMIRDAELSNLETKAQELLVKFNKLKEQKLLEEICCFKDVLALQRQFLQSYDRP
jgi:hypothetical protein